MLSRAVLLAGVRQAGQIVLLVALAVRLVVFFHEGLRGRLERRLNYRRFDPALAVGLLALVVSGWVVTLFYVPSRSMQPTLEVFDGIAVNRLAYHFRKPQINEVVVFALPQDRPGGGRDLVKRVVGCGGDVLRLQRGVLYRNDVAGFGGPADPRLDFPNHKVAPGFLFVMGDNRSNSVDSRVFGEVSEKWLYGPVLCRYWPPSRWGWVR
ncbi:signal peptidase I [bacterium]|nr:signal peptidase I [bacterium]